MSKKVFYFNIIYSCNNYCVFCYSHNTKHHLKPYNEFSINDFKKYLDHNEISSSDRIVINGGEPLLHSNINEIFEVISLIGCEVVTFTNGRLLNNIRKNLLNKKFRFVVPIHGYESLHDEITRVKGSFKETMLAMNNFTTSSEESLLDLKIIINSGMISTNKSFEKCLDTYDKVIFNNAVHITKMAETPVSKKNKCSPICNSDASHYTRFLLTHFLRKGKIVKVYDTCIKNVDWIKTNEVETNDEIIEMKARDFKFEEIASLSKKISNCQETCLNRNFCLSAVDEYKALEFHRDKVYEGME